MKLDCMRVRRHIQACLDRDEGGLTDRDALHLESCTRCGALLRSNSHFSRGLRHAADSAAAELESPSWGKILAGAASARSSAASPGSPQTEASGHPEGPGIEPAAARAEGDPKKGRLLSGRGLMRLLPTWATTTAAKAALVAIVLCAGVILGYREYRFAAARSTVRSSTTEFVNAIFSSSIFTASSEPPALPGAVEADAGWFNATDSTVVLPPPPPAAATSAQSPPASR